MRTLHWPKLVRQAFHLITARLMNRMTNLLDLREEEGRRARSSIRSGPRNTPQKPATLVPDRENRPNSRTLRFPAVVLENPVLRSMADDQIQALQSIAENRGFQG